MIELSKEQKDICDCAIDWYKDDPGRDTLTIGGWAGTGKTSTLSEMTYLLHKEQYINIAFCAFTGKASLVLKGKIKEVLGDFDYVGTIHGLIYKPIIDPKTGLIAGWARKESLEYELIIIDEASMVNKDLYKDLQSYGVPIIAVGDHGQLYPVGNDNFSLMINPDLKLSKIHRQAEDHPIIKLSMMARLDGHIPPKVYSKNVASLSWYDSKDTCQKMLQKSGGSFNWQILCGMNKTRTDINHKIRKYLDLEDSAIPNINEKIICLLNNRDSGFFNGQMGKVLDSEEVSEKSFLLTLKMFGDTFNHKVIAPKDPFKLDKIEDMYKMLKDPKLKLDVKRFGKEIIVLAYAYAITVHKSQGSEWNNVILFEEYNSYQDGDDCARWLYTGVTRAKNTLLIINDY